VENYRYLQGSERGYVGDLKISSPYLSYAKLKGSIMGSDLNLPQADWKRGCGKSGWISSV